MFCHIIFDSESGFRILPDNSYVIRILCNGLKTKQNPFCRIILPVYSDVFYILCFLQRCTFTFYLILKIKHLFRKSKNTAKP